MARISGVGNFLRIFFPIVVMAPACVIGKQPQSFAIPYHAVDSKDDGVYLTPLLRLSQIGAELTRLAYSTPNRIVSWAIVEEDVITEGPLTRTGGSSSRAVTHCDCWSFAIG